VTDGTETRATIDRLAAATNAHDPEAIAACFADDYELTSPIHPARSFRGAARVRENWRQILAAVPDIAVRVVRAAYDGDVAWTEWEMTGTRRDGAKHEMVGVFVFGVRAGVIGWGRMFLEPVDRSCADANAPVRAVTRPAT
jgi:ketosteroid isomerase-like protein